LALVKVEAMAAVAAAATKAFSTALEAICSLCYRKDRRLHARQLAASRRLVPKLR
jgi:hypothetical protein